MDRTDTRRESRNIAGRFRGGKLAPVMAVAFKGGEGGMLSQTATIELDPIAGRLLTPVTAEMFAVYVPVQAMDLGRTPNAVGAGVTEMIRRKLLNGEPIFVLENEGEVSKRLGVMPRSVGGVKKVSEAVRLAHNCAVNYLRKRRYVYAQQTGMGNTTVTPALLSSTALDRFNGVLDPDDRINGALNFQLLGDSAKVRGLGLQTPTGAAAANQVVVGPDGSETFVQARGVAGGGAPPAAGQAHLTVRTAGVGAAEKPTVEVDTSDLEVGGLTLTDLYNAETMDRITRRMRTIIDANPVDGENQIVRWAHGLEVDTDQNCFLIHGTEVTFGQQYQTATDGAGMENEVAQSKMMVRMQFSVPVPRTELGGIVITFLTVKPDEVLYQQPHPFLSDVWVQDNLVAEELRLDPVPVLARDVQADVAQAAEGTVCFYTGYNELKRMHVNYGFNRHLDPATVAAKNAIWQVNVPASVTPQNIIYPVDLPHYPFLDQNAEVASYMVRSECVVRTPIFFGPSPVETVAVIDSANLFDKGAEE